MDQLVKHCFAHRYHVRDARRRYEACAANMQAATITVTAAPNPQLTRAEVPWPASRWGPIQPPTSTATEMSVTSGTHHLGFGDEGNERHWLRADMFTSAARSHATAMMVTTFPGPLYAGATVCTPQKALKARMHPAGAVARRTDASCAWRAARSCCRAAPGGIEPGECFSMTES
jgi:hypothetical protein